MLIYSKYSSVPGGKRLKFPVITRRGGLVVLVVTTTLLALLKLASWLNAQEMFVLKQIEVEGNRFVKQTQIAEMLHLDASQSLFELDLKAIAQQVARHPYIKRAWVNRKLPDNLVIRVEENEPLAVLNSGSLSIIGEDGKSLPNLQVFDLMDFPIISNIAVGENERLNTVVRFLRQIKDDMFPLYSQLSEVSYSESAGLYVYLLEGSVPILFGEGDYASKSANLLKVLKILQKDSSLAQVKMLDLRYKDQVIVKDLTS